MFRVCKGSEGNDEQGREFSKQQWNHCCVKAKQVVLSSRSKAKMVCWAQKFICILPIHFKAVVSSGRQSLQLYSSGLQVVKEGQN